MKPSVSKELLFDHFAGKTTPLQKQLIANWLRLAENQEYFYAWLVEWELRSPQYIPEIDDALKRYEQHIKVTKPAVFDPAERENPPVFFRSRNWPVWMAAASLLIGLLMTGWLNQDRILYQTFQTDYGETQSVKLDDGSTVVLNANSVLRVPRFRFGQRTREVLLTGEADFSVAHTPTHQQFIVQTNQHFDVVVLGTEFTVNSRPRAQRVVLKKGKVQVRYQEGKHAKQVMMKPGDLVTFSKQHTVEQTTTPTPLDYSAWKEHRFVFDDTPLSEVAAMLSENYGLRVTITGDALAQRTLVGSFRAATADELLETVSQLLNIQVIRRQGEIVLTENP